MPAEGDWAVGIDIAPFLSYVGNLANGNTSNSSPTWNFTAPLQLFGKWFRADDLAWRGRLRFLGINNSTTNGFVQDDVGTDPFAQVEDKKEVSRMNTTLGFGMEKRKGSTRLQGFWGGEVILSFSSGSDKYSYGNALTSTNQSPSTYDFGDGNTSPIGATRVTEVKYGSGFSFGVRPFIGAEYFLFPKMSIGGEFGYFLGFGSQGETETTVEYYDAANSTSATATVKSGQSNKSTFKMDNDNLSGSIKLMLHF